MPLAQRADVELVICDEQYEQWFLKYYQPDRVLTVSKIEQQYGFEDLLREWDLDPKENITRFRDVETGRCV